MEKNKKGFTLVEIMIVVVIIGLLAAMAVPAFQAVRNNARTKAVLNNLRQVAGAAQQYMLEEGVTQVTVGNLQSGGYLPDTIESVGTETYTFTIGESDTSLTVTSGAAGTDADVVYLF